MPGRGAIDRANQDPLPLVEPEGVDAQTDLFGDLSDTQFRGLGHVVKSIDLP